MIEWIENRILRIWQYFCKHKYRKHYEQCLGCYVNRCVKCGKRITREPPGRSENDDKSKYCKKLY